MSKQIVLCLVSLAASAYIMPAQSTTGTISGIVTDSTGASVAGAKITATELATNVARSSRSASDGSYSILFLPVGAYRVEVNTPGFKKFERSGIVLEVNRNARVDAALELGALTETVVVTADVAIVETSNPTLGQTVN